MFEIKVIQLPVTVVESPINAAISCNVLRTSGAEPTSFAISSLTSCLVNESKPLIVIVLSVDDKAIFVPGTILFNILLNKIMVLNL